jgi:hypothetical protein
MMDLTVGETKKFEELPEDKWVLARIVKRDVIRWVEADRKFNTSADEIIIKLMKKLAASQDESEQWAIRAELKGYQFSFVFQILDQKKYAGYVIKGRTGIWLNFTNTAGEEDPNKLAKLYLGAGGSRGKKGERVDIDSIIGNYVAIKAESQKNKTTRKVYQHVIDVRELTTDELVTAKTNEYEVDKVEKALKAIEEKTLTETVSLINFGTLDSFTQKPVMDSEPQTPGEIPF